jgi:hypothetical protein
VNPAPALQPIQRQCDLSHSETVEIPPARRASAVGAAALLLFCQFHCLSHTSLCSFLSLNKRGSVLTTTSGGRPPGRQWGEGVTAEEMGDYIWLRPETVAEIKFAEWTPPPSSATPSSSPSATTNPPPKSSGKSHKSHRSHQSHTPSTTPRLIHSSRNGRKMNVRVLAT